MKRRCSIDLNEDGGEAKIQKNNLSIFNNSIATTTTTTTTMTTTDDGNTDSDGQRQNDQSHKTQQQQQIDFTRSPSIIAATATATVTDSDNDATVPYNILNCMAIIEAVDNFLNAESKQIIRNETFNNLKMFNKRQCLFLASACRREIFCWNLESLSLNCLRGYFSGVGHDLSIAMDRSFNVPLYFDVDCINCKNDIMVCSDKCCSPQYILNLVNNMKRELFAFFKKQKIEIKNILVTCSTRGCGFHVYFDVNFSVTMVVYQYLITNVLRDCFINSRYRIDCCWRMPLAYSSKVDNAPYKILGDNFNYLNDFAFSIPPQVVDFNYQQKHDVENSDEQILCKRRTIKNSNSNNDDDDNNNVNILESFVNFKLIFYNYIVFKPVPVVISTERVPNLINNLKSNDFEINNRLLENFMQTLSNNSGKMSIDNGEIEKIITNCRNAEMMVDEFEIFNEIEKFMIICGTIAGYFLYDRKLIYERLNIYYYLQMFKLPAESFGDAMHLIFCLIVNCMHRCKIVENVNVNLRLIISYIKSLTMSVFSNNVMLNKIFDALERYPQCVNEILQIYDDPYEIVWFIIYENLKYKIGSESNEPVEIVFLQHYLQCSALTQDYLLQVMKFKFKIMIEDETVYMYNLRSNGTYKYCDLQNFHKSDEMKSFLLNLTLLDGQKTKKKENQIVLGNAWIVFKDSIKKINVNFHNYSYFVNTSQGIFFNLAGIYVNWNFAYFFLSFRQCLILKDIHRLDSAFDQLNGGHSSSSSSCSLSQCVQSRINFLQMNEENTSVERRVIEIANTIQRYCQGEGDNILAACILVPGLLNMDNIMLTDRIEETTITVAQRCLLVKGGGGNDGNNMLLRLFEDLFLKYQFPLETFRFFSLLFFKKILQFERLKNIDEIYNLYKFHFNSRNLDENIVELNCQDCSIDEQQQFSMSPRQIATMMNCNLEYVIFIQILLILMYEKDCELNENLHITKAIVNMKINCKTVAKENIHYGMSKCFVDLDVDCMEYKALSILIPIFKYDVKSLYDFLQYSCMIYQPKNDNKAFLLLYGPHDTGKTVITNAIIKTAKPNNFAQTTSMRDSKSSAPDNRILKISTSSVTSIPEATFLQNSIVKILTGNDKAHFRGLYERNYKEISCSSFIIGNTNKLIKINPEEAIRRRMVVISNTTSFVIDCDLLNDNALVNYINGVCYAESINKDHFAFGLVNLQYGFFIKLLNENGMMMCKLKSESSKLLINRIFAANSRMYKVLFENGIDIDDRNIIMEDELREIIEPRIMAPYTWDEFKSEFSNCFHQKLKTMNDGQKYYIGIGIRRKDDRQVKNHIRMMKVEDVAQSSTLKEIKNLIKTAILDESEQNLTFNLFKKEYGKFIENNIVVGYKIC